MTRHLRTCGLSASNPPAVTAPGKRLPDRSFHLFVEARYAKGYWMHPAVLKDATLDSLDSFLRQIWLECCGRLSAFTIEGRRYVSSGMEDFGRSGMGVRLGRLLQPGMVFNYEYDFGSTTELSLKVLDMWDRRTQLNDIELLARNDAPKVVCDRCGSRPATTICTECSWKNQGWLCKSCAAGHECSEEMFLPVVHSPRTGVCGYCG